MQSLAEIQALLSAKQTNLVQIVEYYLSNIQQRENINAFVEVFTAEAKQRAIELDQKRKNGQPIGRLHGMVIALKDNICFEGHQVTAASKILEGYEAIYSATVVQKLLAEDAIIIGRTSCDEFAMGSSNEHSVYGPVLNPLDESRVPGGSSGGSAAAVAADMCLTALGSDTGGSIRQPAAFCGLVGMKPTYGRVSRYGLLAYGSSFDQIGPFGKNANDVAAVLDVIADHDERDATSISKSMPSLDEEPKEDKYSFVYFEEFLAKDGLSESAKKVFENSIEQLKADGHEVKSISFKLLPYLIPTYYVLTTAEASSNLSRYDGIHYGYRSSSAKDINEIYTASRSEGFGAEVKRRIMLGTFVLSAGYYGAYYAHAQKVRRRVRDEVASLFEQFDFVLSPTTTDVAFEFGAKQDPVAMYMSDIYTVLANLTGMPAISLPQQTENELPVGLQLMTNNYEEDKLFKGARLIEQLAQ